MMPPTDLLDATFAALADPTRRAILARLAHGEATVTELAAPFAMSQPAVSQAPQGPGAGRAHLPRPRRAAPAVARLEAQRLKVAVDWLADYRQYWEESYGRLDALLERVQASDAGAPGVDRRGARPRTAGGAPSTR
jgi:hypothetical protein